MPAPGGWREQFRDITLDLTVVQIGGAKSLVAEEGCDPNGVV